MVNFTAPSGVDPSVYPPPRVPAAPVLSFNFCRGGNSSTIFSVHDAGNSVLLTSGRDGIATALKQIGVNRDCRVLLPAYNCRAMVEAVEWSGADAVFYRINPDLITDIDDIRRNLQGVKVIIAVHYFGFPQKLLELRNLCDDAGLQLIEDCAHAYFGVFDGAPPGSIGDYAIASLMKFFPIFDGGCLVSSRHALSDKGLMSGGPRFEVKALFNILERAVRYSRLRPLNWILPPILRFKDFIRDRVKHGTDALATVPASLAAADYGCGFDPRWLKVRISWISKFIFRRSSTLRCTQGRRANYQYFRECFDNVPGCRPIFRDLDEGVIPYVFPLYVEDPDRVFPLIKMRGVPVFRWEDVEAGVCENSSRYSLHLFQLPCHEELRVDERRWICDTMIDAIMAKSL